MNKEIKIFNSKTSAHKTGNYPLFFGEGSGLYDNINQPYPYLYDLVEKLKQLDWSPDDVDLTQTRMDLLKCGEGTRKFMLFNLAYQWSLDSIAMSIPTLFAPFITNSEYGHLLSRIGENEMLHSQTYSNIVRQCVRDPQEVFNMVYEHEEVLQRSDVVHKVLSDLKRVGAEFTLGLISEEDVKPYVLKGLVAVYSLERISFLSSFSCTFALAEQEFFVGGARLVQKILMDEMVHYEAGRYVLQEVLLKTEEYSTLFNSLKSEMEEIISGVVEQELNWNTYLFKEGAPVVGLNKTLLDEWVKYNAQDVYKNLDIKPYFELVKGNPLPWFEQNWMDLNSHQNANMEADATNYQVSSVSRDTSNIVFEDFDFE